MQFTDKQWRDIELEDARDEIHDMPGWVFVCSPRGLTDLHHITSVSATRLDGSTRDMHEASAIAVEKARRSYLAAFGTDPHGIKVYVAHDDSE